ncbi:MAG: hypothetical protein ACRD26_11305 [Vicinamibacterales bacterium]
MSRSGSDRSWVMSGLDDRAATALLETLPASALWSLLLAVMDRRAQHRSVPDLARQWKRDGFTQPATVDQRTLNALDGHLLAAAADFEAIELSPLAPLGSCSVVGLASQNKIVSALRGTELVADPTNVFALECARRLRIDASRVVRLATCHRCVRGQEVPKLPGYTQHFRIFCLATAGRERRDHGLLVEALTEHIATHLRALDRLEQHGYAFSDRRVRILATEARASVADRLAAMVPGIPVARERLDRAYYDGLRFMIDVRSAEGDAGPLIDGGVFDWVGRLAANRRLVFVASGMGAQLVAARFGGVRTGSE